MPLVSLNYFLVFAVSEPKHLKCIRKSTKASILMLHFLAEFPQKTQLMHAFHLDHFLLTGLGQREVKASDNKCINPSLN